MIRFFISGGFVAIIALAFWAYCVFDVIATESSLCRNLPKLTWLFVVLLFSVVGCVAWLALGRPPKAGWRPGDTDYRKPMRMPRGPDDDPTFLDRVLGTEPPARDPAGPDRSSGAHPAGDAPASGDPGRDLAAWEADLRRREEELRRREEGEPEL